MGTCTGSIRRVKLAFLYAEVPQHVLVVKYLGCRTD
jgi:hypothetical protein